MTYETRSTPTSAAAPQPIVALDVASAAEALALVERLGMDQPFVKVGLQLYTAAGPDVVRALRARGCRVFLDLKLHDIPNTVAQAVGAAGALGVDLLTVHAAGGPAMLRAAQAAAAATGVRLLAVTVLTSMDARELGAARGADVEVAAEVARLAGLAAGAGIHGVVASVHEIAAIRATTGGALRVLTPGIRLAGGDAHDQARVATPAEAARLGADYLVLGRAVTAAADPAAALRRAAADAEAGAVQEVGA